MDPVQAAKVVWAAETFVETDKTSSSLLAHAYYPFKSSQLAFMLLTATVRPFVVQSLRSLGGPHWSPQ